MAFRFIAVNAVLGFGLWLTPAGATTALKGMSSYFYTTTKTDDLTYTVYAGNTSKACASSSTSSPCDSCAAWTAPIYNFSNDRGTFPNGLICNSKQIHTNLIFEASLSSDQATMYTNCSSAIKMFVGTSSLAPSNVSSFTVNQAGQTVTAQWTWGAICQALGSSTFGGGSTACTASFSKQVQIAFDKDCNGTAAGESGAKVTINFRYVGGSDPMTFSCPEATTNAYEGFCDFTVYPGDEKVYIYEAAANNANSLKVGDLTATEAATAADPSGMKYSAVRFFYEAANAFTTLTPASSYKDVEISETSLIDKKITGLTNGTQYIFLAANVDQAGNVTHFSDPQYARNGIVMNATAGLGDSQSAIPEKVNGLLDNKNCFIATAAYGSGDEKDVETLRQFRNQFLLKTSFGKKFVRFYYQISPPIAEFIAQHEFLKILVRGALSPFVLMAQWMLEGAQP